MKQPQTSIGLDESDRAALDVIQQHYRCTMAQATRIAIHALARQLQQQAAAPGPAFIEQYKKEQGG